MTERAQFIARFVELLAGRLGRSSDELAEGGLRAQDFTTDCLVRWHDGSEALFKGAFAIVDPTHRRIAVFTEHCGYFDFDQISVLSVDEPSTRTIYSADFS